MDLLPALREHLMELPTPPSTGVELIPFGKTFHPQQNLVSYRLHRGDLDWLGLAVKTFHRRAGIAWDRDHPLLFDAVAHWGRFEVLRDRVAKTPLPPRGELRVVADAGDVKRGSWRGIPVTEVGQVLRVMKDGVPELAAYSRQRAVEQGKEDALTGVEAARRYMTNATRDQMALMAAAGGDARTLRMLGGLAGFPDDDGGAGPQQHRHLFQPSAKREAPVEADATTRYGVRAIEGGEDGPMVVAFAVQIDEPMKRLAFRPQDPTFTWCDECLGVRGSHDPGCSNEPKQGGP